ncbi:hypothetical protein [Cryptosporangium aurantiacum]|uniref:hypothetical protein n=1 Tax=Cryptosporangium aurantiacum TaxID=134849 RepID=UPI0015B7C39E|nr:hypothetical protein [Cryptosporangium aurantiacum]
MDSQDSMVGDGELIGTAGCAVVSRRVAGRLPTPGVHPAGTTTALVDRPDDVA